MSEASEARYPEGEVSNVKHTRQRRGESNVRRRRGVSLVAVALLVALVAAGCGSDNSNEGGGGGGAKERAVITISTTAGNAAREQVEQLLQSQLKEAGFELKINNTDPDTLFGKWLPAGNFMVGMYAQVGTPDPGLCVIFCSQNIPTKANDNVGQNFTRTNVPALDGPLTAQDTEPDAAKRATLVKQASKIMAENNVSLPLYQKPTLLAYNSSALSGPIADNTVNGPFVNANEWTVLKGNGIIAAAEQEPDCTDWIASCAGASWGNWILKVHTAPEAFDVDADGNYVVSKLLTKEPTVAEQGEGMTVTYDIAPDAVWDDGQPITSKDFEYLWKQITTGKDIYDTTGYNLITAVDTSNPKQAVVTLKSKFAPWRDLFGGFYGLYPSHLLEGKDRNAETKDGYTWSGGPWKMESWQKGESMTLVPNPAYWGTKPSASKLVFRFITDSAAQTQAYKTNQVQIMYPQPQVGLVKELQAVADTKVTVGFGNTYEGLWFNMSKSPLDSLKVRQALGYAVDRAAVVDAVITPSLEPIAKGEVLQSFNVPTFKEFFTPAWGNYKYDLAKVDELMKADGWKKGSDGIWERDKK